MNNIYDALGGQQGLTAAVDRFYERVTVDPVLSSFFEGMDLRALKVHQIAFLGQAVGGPVRYDGAGMQKAHAHLRIQQHHFDAVASHLMATLQEFAVSEEVIGAIMERLAPLATQVVNTPTQSAAAAN